MSTQPTFYIPHGAGPCFFMEWTRGPRDLWDPMAAFLRGLIATLPEPPRAIVVVSAHWEEDEFTVNAAEQPPLLFDYSGFPEHTYRLQFPAPGSPVLAGRIGELLGEAGIAHGVETERGLDHGVFIPFLLITPEADIPVVQLSMRRGLDAGRHLAAGAALRTLRDEGVLIVGSGMSWHNMRGFGPAFFGASQVFDDWLVSALGDADAGSRDRALRQWHEAPEALTAQPHPDHLLPLMVAAGAAADEPGRKVFGDVVMGVQVSAFRFG